MDETTKTMHFELPWPPTGNNMYANKKGGGRRLSAQGRRYRQQVYACVLEQHGLFKPFTGPVKTRIFLALPDNRIRDTDNLPKGIHDALKAANVVEDDVQIYNTQTSKHGPNGEAKVLVIVEPVEPQSFDEAVKAYIDN